MTQIHILFLQHLTKSPKKTGQSKNIGERMQSSHKYSSSNSHINKLSFTSHMQTPGEEKLIFKTQYHTEIPTYLQVIAEVDFAF